MRKLIRLLRSQKVNILKTLIFNLRALPFKQAIKFPIYIYSDTKIISIGKIFIESDNIHKGMIRIGKRNFFAGFKTQFINSGEIHFKGNFLIEAGTCINNSGKICFGDNGRVGECSKVIIINSLNIGCKARIAFETVIMDTDFHTIVNTNKGIAKKSYGEINIGSYNWIGNRSMIKKGTRTDDYTIVSSLSMLNKDYRGEEKYPLLAGCPAKVISYGWRRIYNYDNGYQYGFNNDDRDDDDDDDNDGAFDQDDLDDYFNQFGDDQDHSEPFDD